MPPCVTLSRRGAHLKSRAAVRTWRAVSRDDLVTGPAATCVTVRRMPERGAMPWAAVVAFWIFVSVVYAAQIWWVSQTPGEMVNVRQAVTWQSAYFLLWIPVTLVVWRVTATWTPESMGGWSGMLLWH